MAPNNAKWPRPKPADEPVNDVRPLTWLQAWQLFRKIPMQELFPLVFTVPVIVFLALSGLLAWVVVALSFMVRLMKVFI
jgi:hypothetical protein